MLPERYPPLLPLSFSLVEPLFSLSSSLELLVAPVLERLLAVVDGFFLLLEPPRALLPRLVDPFEDFEAIVEVVLEVAELPRPADHQ